MNKENKRQRQLMNQEVQKITEEEVKAAMKRMAVVSDYIPVEGLKCLGERAVNKRGEEECLQNGSDIMMYDVASTKKVTGVKDKQ